MFVTPDSENIGPLQNTTIPWIRKFNQSPSGVHCMLCSTKAACEGLK